MSSEGGGSFNADNNDQEGGAGSVRSYNGFERCSVRS
jgi:hypothetical protein